jgi:ATP-dependent RNA helicase RhlE
MSKILCFVKNKRIANELFEELEKYFLKEIGVIHSNFSQAQRFKAVKRIQDGTHRMLIATDVIARGIDIENITHVINFNISKDPGSYIHRIGRTGRADKIGIAISFISKEEEISQKQIEALMKKKIPLLKLPKNVEISDTLTDDEKPRFRDKSLAKIKKLKTPSGGFSEKQGKNKMIPNKGARRQENERRMILRRITSRSGRIGN